MRTRRYIASTQSSFEISLFPSARHNNNNNNNKNTNNNNNNNNKNTNNNNK